MTDEFSKPSGISLTADEMWKVANKEGVNNWGISGYQVPQNYFDHKKIKNERETWAMHQQVWLKKGHYPPLKVSLDRDGKPIKPKKINFIDECVKQAHSNFSKVKFDKYVDNLKAKGKSLDEIEGIKVTKEPVNLDSKKTHFYKHDRSTYISDIFKTENKKTALSENSHELMNKVKERQGRYSSPKITSSEAMIRKYKNKTSITKADRITVLADSEFLGEQNPFYYSKGETVIDKSIDQDIKKKGQNHLFFPDKFLTMDRSPAWKFNKPFSVDRSFIQRKDELFKEKVENLKKSWENRRINFIDDVSVSYFKLRDGHKGGFRYHKPTEKSSQYLQTKELHNEKSPGPHDYFKIPPFDYKTSPQNLIKNEEQTEGSPKVYYSNRDKIEKKISKPMKYYVF